MSGGKGLGAAALPAPSPTRLQLCNYPFRQRNLDKDKRDVMATTNRVKKLQILEIVGASDLVIDGERVDQRSVTARRWRQNISDLAMQIGEHVTPAEGMLLRRAATFAAMCDRDEALMMKGEAFDEEGYRRNSTALGAALVKLGLAAKSRDVTKAQSKLFDQHAAAVLADD